MSQSPLLKVKIVRTITILSQGRPAAYTSLQATGNSEKALSSTRIYPSAIPLRPASRRTRVIPISPTSHI